MIMMRASSPLSDVVDPLVEVGEGVAICVNEEVLVMSKTMTAALEPLIKEGMSVQKRYCPADSHSCILKLLFSTLICTCSLPVKLSKMNRLIMEVLPTDWSPSITILYLTTGLFYMFEFISKHGKEARKNRNAVNAGIVGLID